ncbi:MAG: nucleotidyltransferase substrate binding protein [Casimicrobiaceae bacterium]|nr:nucleotidyltransferase substrate binding protein [Casimicrobiaceae bacterium]
MTAQPVTSLDLLRRTLDASAEALELWREEPEASRRKRHLRAGLIQSFEFSYELAVKTLQRVLAERALVPSSVAALSFNDLLRAAADHGLLEDPLAWRRWRELRNRTSHAYDEAQAQAIAEEVAAFLRDARALEAALARALSP